MADLSFSPLSGIDNVSREPNSSVKALRDAVNVDIDRAGQLSRRAGMLQLDAARATSVRSASARGRLYFISNGALMTVAPGSETPVPLLPLEDPEMDLVELNDALLIVGPRTLARIDGVVLTPLGVEDVPPPIVAVETSGGMPAGRYGVCVTAVSQTGEEGAASDAVFVDVPENGGIEISALPVPLEPATLGFCIYMTAANGGVFYSAARVQSGVGAFSLGVAVPHGRVCDTAYLERMRGGLYPRIWRGRLLVARGRTIYMSEPMRYGLYSPRTGFVQMPKLVTFIQPVRGGIYVGQPDGVLFLRGNSPAELEVVDVGAAPPVRGSAIEVAGTELTSDNIRGAEPYAIWLGARGYAFGSPDGQVSEPQAKVITLSPGSRGTTTIAARRLTTLVT